MAIQNRRGYEADFDPAKMLPGEWAVSLDTKYVRMCFAPGECLRMATYEGFEQDMEEVRRILAECQDIQTAIEQIRNNISDTELVIENYVSEAKKYRDEAKQFRDEAEAFTPDGYADLVHNVADNTVKIDTVIEKAELNIKNTASGKKIHLTDSADSKVVAFGLYGKAEQNGEPTPDNPIEITVSGSDGSIEVESVGKNLAKLEIGSLDTYTGEEINATNRLRTQFIEIKPYTNYIATNGSLIVKNGVAFDKNKNYISRGVYPHTENNILNVQNANAKYVRLIYALPDNSDLSPEVDYVYQLEEGTTPTEYQPHTETTSLISTPDGLASVGGVYDEIIKYADGSGKRIQRVINIVKDNMLLVRHSATNENYFVAYVANTGKPSQSSVISTHFTQSALPSSLGISSCMYVVLNNDAIHISIPTSIANDVNTLKTWLLDNDVKICYPLATPIITDLTAEEIAEIEKLHTFYPVTNISNDADCDMEVTYLADAKNYIDGRLASIEFAMINKI